MGLFIRYCNTFVNDDYEEAASILDEFIISSSPGDTLVALAQQLVTFLAMLRSSLYCTREYSEEAIYRALSDSSSVEEPAIVFDPEGVARKSFRDFGFSEDVSRIFSFFPLTRTSLGKCFGFYPRNLEDLFDDNPDLRKLEKITGILLGILNDDRINIDEAIEKAESILASCSPTTGVVTSAIPMVFGMILLRASIRTNKIEYLNESISICRRLLGLPLIPLQYYVSGYFYQSMFPKKEKGEPEPYYKRSAGALRDAVKKLRKKRWITLERWVNFVHYGA
jgi:hypothetical protein